MPAIISPTTRGWPALRASVPAKRTAARMMASCKKKSTESSWFDITVFPKTIRSLLLLAQMLDQVRHIGNAQSRDRIPALSAFVTRQVVSDRLAVPIDYGHRHVGRSDRDLAKRRGRSVLQLIEERIDKAHSGQARCAARLVGSGDDRGPDGRGDAGTARVINPLPADHGLITLRRQSFARVALNRRTCGHQRDVGKTAAIRRDRRPPRAARIMAAQDRLLPRRYGHVVTEAAGTRDAVEMNGLLRAWWGRAAPGCLGKRTAIGDHGSADRQHALLDRRKDAVRPGRVADRTSVSDRARDAVESAPVAGGRNHCDAQRSALIQ